MTTNLAPFLNPFTGDTGDGGTEGLVPAPAAGDGIEKFLKADGSWQIPSGSGGGGVTTVGALDGETPNANAAAIQSTTIYMQSASASAPGVVNTTTQTLVGPKTLNNTLTINTSSNHLALGTTSKTTITSSITANRTLTLPDANSNTVRPLGSATANNWVQYIGSDGTQNLAQPAFSNLSGQVNLATQVTGILGIANGGTGRTTLGSANQFLAVDFLGSDLEYKSLITGTAGTDFNIDNSSIGLSILNIPSASATARGLITPGTQTIGGNKTIDGTFTVNHDGFPLYVGATYKAAFSNGRMSKDVVVNIAPEDSVTVQPVIAPTLNSFVTYIDVDGIQYTDQPTFSNIAGTVLPAQLPNPTSSTLGGIQSAAAQTNKWIYQISPSGVPALSQPAFSNLSGQCDLTSQVTNSLPVANGGTGLTSLGTANQLLGMNSGASTLEYKTLNGSSSVTVTHGTNSITLAATGFSGSLSGDVTGTQGSTVVASVGGQTATNVAAGAVLANAATSANTASAIVKRDSNGLFNTSGTIWNTVLLISNASAYTVLATDTYIFVNLTSAPNTRQINLPNTPVAGRAFYVGDNAGAGFPIVITTAGGSTKFADGTLTSYTIYDAWGGAWFVGDGTRYNIVSTYVGQGLDGNLLIMGSGRPTFGNATTAAFTFGNATDATSSTAASLVCSGGFGLLKKFICGSSGEFQSTTDATSSTVAALKTSGGISSAKGMWAGTFIKAGGTTASTSPTTGTIISGGGIGANGDIFASGGINSTSTTDASSSISGGSGTFSGGLAVNKKLYVGTGIYLPTSGGTSAQLDFYEEFSTSVTMTGPNSRTISSTMYLTRIGKIVCMVLTGGTSATGTGNTSASSSAGAIPSRFRPNVQVTAIYDAFVTGGGGEQAGKCDISTAGTMTLYATVAGGTFNISGTSWGFATFMAVWRVT